MLPAHNKTVTSPGAFRYGKNGRIKRTHLPAAAGGGRLLLAKRAKEPGKGKWSLPGGAIEPGETVYDAARREALEECSVNIQIERVLDAADIIVKDERGRIVYHYVIIDLLARYAGGELKAGSDAADCGWFTPAEVAGMDITPTLRTMLKKHGMI